MVVVIIVLAVLASVVVDIVFFAWWIRRLRGEAIEALREVVGEEKVYQVEDCNYFGLQSAGLRQWRDNGVIALTGRGVRFRMFLPRRELFVPLGSVREVSHPRSFLGRSKARELLRVDFRDEAGDKDACAWLMPFPQWWGEAIAALRAGGEPPPAPWRQEKA